MLNHIKNRKIASFKLGGEKFDLIPQEMTRSADSYSKKIGDLLVTLNLQTVAKAFYRWVVILENKEKEKTAQITELCGMDMEFPVEGEAKWESIQGDRCWEHSFMPREEAFSDGVEIKRTANAGRPSKGDCFPYFDVTSDLGTTVFAIGWTGQWAYTMTRNGNTASLKIGFDRFDTYLNPGETVRSVGILMYNGTGLLETRQSFRRIFREKLSPAASRGGTLNVPISLQVFDRYFMNHPYGNHNPDWATEAGQIHCIACAKKCEYINNYWLDAAWFREGFPTGVGNYDFHYGFPNGLAPISSYAHENGMTFQLWFEPERVDRRSDTALAHPEWMLDYGNPEDPDLLFKLADEDAFCWLRDTLIRMIRENGIDIYRQDFNMNPSFYWNHSDTEGRIGYIENKHVSNLYRLWDAILAEFPGILIDNCSSGGQRLDFELNMRGIPMWRSDTACFPASEENPTHLWHQNQTLGLSRYLPFHSLGTWSADAYMFRSTATMGIACSFHVMDDSFNAEDVKKPLLELTELQKLWNGDFYPLTNADYADNVWCAYQLALGDSGFCAFFRRENAPEAQMTFTINAIDAEKDYEITLTDNDYVKTVRTVKGAELSSFTAEIKNTMESLILVYEAI